MSGFRRDCLADARDKHGQTCGSPRLARRADIETCRSPTSMPMRSMPR